MRLGVELYSIKEGETGGLVPHLQGVLEALFAGWPEHEVLLFGTDANRNLLPKLPLPHVQLHTLPRDGFFPLLDVYASYFQLDALLRSCRTLRSRPFRNGAANRLNSGYAARVLSGVLFARRVEKPPT